MAATELAFAVSLTVVLALVAFLFAEYLCSARRRRQGPRRYGAADHAGDASAATAAPEVTMSIGAVATPPPLSSKPLAFPFYGHGVIRAPTSFLLTIPNLEAAAEMAPSAFEPPAMPAADHLVYISNPVYDSNVAACGGGSSTSFETPDTSPSHLGWEEEEEEEDQVERGEDDSPTITVMRKLPVVQPKVWAAGMDLRRPSEATSGSGATETNMANSFFSSSTGSSSSPPW